jgi:hypothetical protein
VLLSVLRLCKDVIYTVSIAYQKLYCVRFIKYQSEVYLVTGTPTVSLWTTRYLNLGLVQSLKLYF